MKYPDITLGRVEAVWNKLGGEDGVQRFLAGLCDVTVKEYVIDCDAAPFVPYDGWTVVEHRQGGQLTFDPSHIELWLANGQRGSDSLSGDKLLKELHDKPVLNANVLDFLLDNPRLIPKTWHRTWNGSPEDYIVHIPFWGTVYRDENGMLCVRSLYWLGDLWDWDYLNLENTFCADRPAALLVR